MVVKILEKMIGEELLLLKIFKGKRVSSFIDAELNRRAMTDAPLSPKPEDFWAGRTFAMRHSSRMAA